MAWNQLFRYDTIQKFNETDMMLYKYLIRYAEKIPYMTIRELAAENGVSTSTVLRFCNRIGCESYQAFKEEFQMYATSRKKVPLGMDLQQLFQYFQGIHTEAFEEKIQEGAGMIRSADVVVFAGMGSSGALARYGARYFSNFGKFAVALEDDLYPLSEMNYPQTAVVAMSVSGETKRVIETIRKFQGRQCKVLSITNEPNSTIARMSDWNLSYCLEMQTINGGFNATSQIPVLFMIEALARRI